MVNPQNLNAVLRVPGESISKVKEGQRVLIKKEYYSTNSLTGKVKEISMLSEESSSGGKDCFKIRVSLPQLIGEDLIMGINKVIYGEIILEEKANVIRIPFDAIHYEESGTPFVFIFANGMVKKQRIVIGIKGEEYIEIKNGVDLRDKIIIEENSELVDGQRVKLQGKDG